MADNLTYNQSLSSVNPSFWSKLTELKLNVDKLNVTNRKIWGYFTCLNHSNVVSLVEVDSTSFNEEFNGQFRSVPFQGSILNLNTIEDFKDCNKTELLNNEGKKLMESIKNGAALKDPSLLNYFMVLCFADLKKYHYYYWFSFPVLKDLILQKECLKEIPPEYDLNKLYKQFEKLNPKQQSYFLIESEQNELIIHTLEDKIASVSIDNHKMFYFAFFNISCTSDIPGSQLRNYAAFILNYCPFLQNQQQQFIAFNLRLQGSRVSCHNSKIYNLILPYLDTIGNTWVGWEKNERDKMGPKLANMRNSLDPTRLADHAVDLNLKLMKWRIMPNIDLNVIKSSKCLILGSGTLGCSVARTLLAWGVRHITFVDNSTVSFSNPVRQSLFNFEDSLEGKPKAIAAADNLRKIFPGVNTCGHQLSIPMPGHTIGESLLNQTKESVSELCKLIEGHEVIFLLMDSRESRWLPTLLGCVYNKIVINAALGFDTYLVMRHGGYTEEKLNPELHHPEGFKSLWGNQLGCYFCNDVTAPGNSLKDRTLDQQCTVTRPGVSQIAGALAVELAVSLLQHQDRNNAPAFYQVGQKAELDSENENQTVLGLLPHSIRGFLSSFNQVLPATQKFLQCIACSSIVVDEYKKKGFDFLLEVFNSSKYLEDLTGLTEIFKETDCGDVWEFSDDESNE